MSAKICKCGNETNEPDGVCVVCKFDFKHKIDELRAGTSDRIRRAGTRNDTPPPTPPPSRGRIRERGNGGERMEERDYKGHQKCSKEKCVKYAVKEGLCYRHFKEEHGHAPFASSYKRKKAKVLPPPEIKDRKKDSGQAGMTEKKTTSTKVSDELSKVVAQIRTLAKEEIREDIAPLLAGIRMGLAEVEEILAG
jgi:hypothetical protein